MLAEAIESIGGIRVKVVERPEEALTALEACENPALLVMDLGYPCTDGSGKIEIRGNRVLPLVRRKYQHLAIVVATTLGGDAYEAILECERHHLHDDWIDVRKGVAPNEIKARISALLFPLASVSQRGLWLVQISDLHFGHSAEFGYLGLAEDGALFEKLARDLGDRVRKDERRFCGADVLCMVGDMTHRGRPEEFAKAARFTKALREVLQAGRGADSTELLIVPGNHDVNWDVSFARSVNPERTALLKLSSVDEVPSELRFVENLMWVPFGDFLMLADASHPTVHERWTRATQYEGGVWSFPKLGTQFVGFNSTGRTVNNIQKSPELSIELIRDLEARMRDANYANEGLPRIALVHHPAGAFPGFEGVGGAAVRDVRLAIASRLETTIFLCGHVHGSAVEMVTVGNRSILVCGSGSASAKGATRETTSLGYNVIGLLPASRSLGSPAKAIILPRACVNGEFFADPSSPRLEYEWNDLGGWARTL